MNVYEFIEKSYTDLTVGVDAITLTAKSPTAWIGLRGALDTLQDAIDLNEKKQFRFNGAIGWSSGSIRYAERFDHWQKREWAILMVTGEQSQGIVKFYDFDLNCSRIDLRVDVALKARCADFAERCYKVNPRGLNPRLIQSLVGSTFYPTDNREGTYYGRIYDKSPEYGLDLGWVWRFEVEIKRKAASPTVEQLIKAAQRGEGETYIAETVFGVFGNEWRTPTPKVGVVPKLNYVGASVSSPEAKLDWLRRNVAPTVKFLRRLGYGEQVDEILEYSQFELFSDGVN